MIRLKQTVVVEGKYDLIRLRSLLDANIMVTDGFAIFQDRQKVSLLRTLAQRKGLVILTDSDRAGFAIRQYITQCIGKRGEVYQAYIPDILGKEKRKAIASKEGTLGVEGMSDEILQEALRKAGVIADRCEQPGRQIEMADLYEAGLCGRANSAQRRRQLLQGLELPARLSTKGLLSVLRNLYTYEEYQEQLERLDQS